jgi:hypothetical protein
MAARKSNPAALAGPNVPSAPRVGARPRNPRGELDDALGAFSESLCVLQVICLALEGAQEESPASVTAFAVALRNTLSDLDRLYTRFDLSLAAIRRSGGARKRKRTIP